MPAIGERIGRIVKEGEGTFLWQIPEFTGLPKEEGNYFMSPVVHLAGMKWELRILPNGVKDVSQRMFLQLIRWDYGPAKTFHCTVGVRHANQEEKTMGRQTAKLGFKYVWSVFYSFLNRAAECEEGDILSSNTLTITFRITEEGEDKTSRENQREVSEKATKREDDSLSPEAKGVMILSKHMKELLVEGDDCDVIIRVKGKEFPAHRNILKSRSPVFRMMLTHKCEENNSGVISIEDCDTDAFEEFLSYMYCGKTGDLTPTKAINLYFIADKYIFPELKEQCVIFLKTSLSASNICDVILLSAKHEDKDLLEFATNFFVQNMDEILLKVEWQNFLAKHPAEGNELYIKSLIHIRASYMKKP